MTGNMQPFHSEALRQLNLRNAEFWHKENGQRETRIAKRLVLRSAIVSIKSEADRGVPIYLRRTFEDALSGADIIVKRVMTDRGREGGRTPKADLFTVRIREIVKTNLDISEHELRLRLKEEVGQGIVIATNIWSYIEYEKDSGEKVRLPVSAIKDRLYRAKKYFRAKH